MPFVSGSLYMYKWNSINPPIVELAGPLWLCIQSGEGPFTSGSGLLQWMYSHTLEIPDQWNFLVTDDAIDIADVYWVMVQAAGPVQGFSVGDTVRYLNNAFQVVEIWTVDEATPILEHVALLLTSTDPAASNSCRGPFIARAQDCTALPE